jgi:cellulose synthase/poly-beta-1,6-N-acetylglucosamine synthase-like glycosyltransferase
MMTNHFPLVSLIMAIRNEAVFIEESLIAVLGQDYPRDKLEILIADGESDDDTLSKIHQCIGAHDRVTILNNPYHHQSYGLNQAIQQATGDVIVRVDGHTIIAPDYVRMCVAILQKTRADCVGGKQQFIGITSMAKVIASTSRSWFSVPSQFRIGRVEGEVDTVYLGAWPKTAFEQIGYFNTSLLGNEDYELCYRIRQAGGTVYLSPQIQSIYYGRSNLKDLWRQYFRYGRAKLQMLTHYPQSAKARHLIAPAFVLFLLSGAIAMVWHPYFLLWGGSLVLYGLMTLVATFQAVLQNSERRLTILLMPLILFIIHVAWGSGFLFESGYQLLKQLTRTTREQQV